MARSTIFFFFFLAFFFNAFQAATANLSENHPLVPAIYVFGDSTADAGNNNHLKTRAKADKWPYGIDFNNVTGRFSNGKTGADFLAIYLGLPMAPPYLNLSESERSQIDTGINYASGSCGILNTTGDGDCLSLDKQVEYFTSTVKIDLPKAINNETKLSEQVAESIYLLLIGNNDFIPQVNGNITVKFSPDKFAELLLDEITKNIKKLHDLGARKFLLSGISICEPYNYKEKCESRYYADKLPQRLDKLKEELPGSLYTIYDGFKIFKQVFEQPEKYGFTHINEPCFQPGKSICPDRSKYNQFDVFGHQTEASHEIASRDCFNGTACFPFTLLELAKAHTDHY